MPPKSLSKVQKSIGKKTGAKKGLHVNSRDAHRLQRAGDRDARVAKTEKLRRQQHAPYQARVAAAQTYVSDLSVADPFATPLSIDEGKALVRSYIARNDEEAQTSRDARRPGRPGTARDAQLEQAKTTEEAEFKSGWWMADVFSVEGLQALKAWDGLWTSLGLLKFVRLDVEGRVTQSAFPPRKG